MKRREGGPVPGEGEIFTRPELDTGVPRHAEDITPHEDLAGAEEHRPALHTEPIEGRIAGARPGDVGADVSPMTTRNISGEGAHGKSVPHVLWTGPERRRRQSDPERWAKEDRRLRHFTYGERRTL